MPDSGDSPPRRRSLGPRTIANRGSGSSNPYQFTGRENDGIGLDYNRARYYGPTVQRFISQDPVDFLGDGPNLYSYVLNDPVNGTDPLGQFSLKACLSAFFELLQLSGVSSSCDNELNLCDRHREPAPDLDQDIINGIDGTTCQAEFCKKYGKVGFVSDALKRCKCGKVGDPDCAKLEGNLIACGFSYPFPPGIKP